MRPESHVAVLGNCNDLTSYADLQWGIIFFMDLLNVNVVKRDKNTQLDKHACRLYRSASLFVFGFYDRVDSLFFRRPAQLSLQDHFHIWDSLSNTRIRSYRGFWGR